jgi:hypothetical protein
MADPLLAANTAALLTAADRAFASGNTTAAAQAIDAIFDRFDAAGPWPSMLEALVEAHEQSRN